MGFNTIDWLKIDALVMNYRREIKVKFRKEIGKIKCH